ncbi:CFEM-domain-containing protein, partial [Suhomyces tanzawaensis NRRL Y-17324]
MKFSVLALLAIPTAFVAAAPATTTNPYATYPQVPKTASINGFADPIYTKLPECAQPCVKQKTSNTPCPYWDTGCLCVMQQFDGPIGECIASSCKGNNVKSATSLASSLCSSAGVPSPYWFVPASVATALSTAA